MAAQLLGRDAAQPPSFLAVGTHDVRLIERIRAQIKAQSVATDAYEVEMLYGIKPRLQQQLRAEGQPLRVLISYGEYWFPWYMRRLAERPANVLFVARNLFA